MRNFSHSPVSIRLISSLLVLFCLAARAEDITLNGPFGSSAMPLEEAIASGAGSAFTKADAVAIQGYIALGRESGSPLECASLDIGATPGLKLGGLFLVDSDLRVENDIRLGGGVKSGEIQVQHDSKLQWGGTLTVFGEKSKFVTACQSGNNIKGGSFALEGGTFRVRLFTPKTCSEILGGASFIDLSGALKIAPGAAVRITLEEKLAGVPLDPGEYFLITCKEVEGDLPELQSEGFAPDQRAKISLKKTDRGLALVVAE